jgi:hypothetical protein
MMLSCSLQSSTNHLLYASGKLITALMVCEQKIFRGSSLYEELAVFLCKGEIAINK